MLVKNLSKGIVDLCMSRESGDETVGLRKQIVSNLVVSLLGIESAADTDDTTDSVSKGLRKVLSFTEVFSHAGILAWPPVDDSYLHKYFCFGLLGFVE